jgi:hypothetical protein
MHIAAHQGNQLGMTIPAPTGASIETDRLEAQSDLNTLFGRAQLDASQPTNRKIAFKTIDLSTDQLTTLWQLDKRTLENIATDPCTPIALLERLAAHPISELRGAVSENKNTPLHTIWTLSKDSDPDVRYQLAENHRLPLPLISALIGDENPYVACRAIKTYERLKAG